MRSIFERICFKNALNNVTLINIQADQMILQTLDIKKKKKKTYLPFIHIEKGLLELGFANIYPPNLFYYHKI